MNSKELENLGQSTLSEANKTGNIPLYFKAIAYFLWAILATMREKKEAK